MRFADPSILLLLIILPLLFWFSERRKANGALKYSSLAIVRQAANKQSLRSRLHRLPTVLRLLALALLIIGLARPQLGMEKIQDINRGIAIEMVVDRSSSMRASFSYNNQETNRLEAVKDIFATFINGDNKNLKGRNSDLIGMISFARFANTNCPLTLAHGALARFLDTIHLVTRRNEDGTAIGDAVALAAARLKTAEETIQDKDDYTIKSKIIILLTDGENNMGSRTPEQAAKLAKKWGIKIYAIGVGGEDTVQIQTFFGTRTMKTGSGVDQNTLQQIADLTGGRFWLAKDGDALQQVYEEIDTLEKSEVESVRYIDYKEQFHSFALAGLFLLLVELILRATWFRRLP